MSGQERDAEALRLQLWRHERRKSSDVEDCRRQAEAGSRGQEGHHDRELAGAVVASILKNDTATDGPLTFVARVRELETSVRDGRLDPASVFDAKRFRQAALEYLRRLSEQVPERRTMA